MKLKKSNIVLICLIIIFFANTAVNFIIAKEKVKEQIENVQTESENQKP
jgi:hypothetical protein